MHKSPGEMPQIACVGVGEMGRATLAILARRFSSGRFLAVDRDESNLDRARQIDPHRVKCHRWDVAANGHLPLEGVDVVLNTVGPFYSASADVAAAALDAGVPYVDICDDVEGSSAVLALDSRARAAGVPVLTGAGSSPGISNFLAKRVLDLRPECDGIRIVWLVSDPDPGGLAPLRHMLHMAAHPAPVWRNGALVEDVGYRPETALVHRFPEPTGDQSAFNTAHPEPLTLPLAFPHLSHVSVQGALLPHWANDAFSTLGRIGFADDDLSVDLGNGEFMSPADFLWRLLWARHRKRHPEGRRGGLMGIQAQGLAGDEVIVRASAVDDAPMMRATGIGAAAAVIVMLEHLPPAGAAGVEVLDCDRALDVVAELAEREGAFPDGLLMEDPVGTAPMSITAT